MCRSKADVPPTGRRCPCSASSPRERAAAAVRKRRSRAQKALAVAQAAGDTQAAVRAQSKLDALSNGTAPPIRAYTRHELSTAPTVVSVRDQIRDAVRRLADQPGRWGVWGSRRWVSLTDLRDQLPHVDREELDRALDELITDPDVFIQAELNQKTLTDRDRAAAVNIAGEDRHVIAFSSHRAPDLDALERVRSQGVAASSNADLASALHTQGVDDELYEEIRAEEQRRQQQPLAASVEATVSAGRSRAAAENPAADLAPNRDPQPVDRASVTEPEAAEPRAQLATFTNRDEGNRYITGLKLKKPELISLAHQLDIAVNSKDTVATIRRKVVDGTVGVREDHAAIRDYAGQRASTTTKPAAPEPDAPRPPVSGRMCDKPFAENSWGGRRNPGDVHFHDDGPTGDAIRTMGADARMDVDGEPLGNVLGRIATSVVTGEYTAQQGLTEVKKIRDRLPQGSQARAALDYTIMRQMDAPMTPVPAVPDNTPEPLRKLVTDLHAIPIVRQRPELELEPVHELVTQLAAGKISARRVADGLKDLANKRHESQGDVGKFEIDRAISRTVQALEQPRAKT